MTILVTAASGQLGHLAIDALLARGVDPAELVAGARTPSKLEDVAARGVRVVELDYDRPDTIASALVGVDRVLFISGSDPADRITGHRNVVAALQSASVDKVVYTSAPKATTFEYGLAADHKVTEELLAASGVPAVIVRNNWYTENYAGDVASAAESGVIAGAVGDAKVASASRADYAEGAVVALLAGGNAGEVYEFAGDVAWTYADLAAAAAEVLGRDVAYQPLTLEEKAAQLASFGLDEGTVAFVVGIDDAIGRGVLGDTDGTLSQLLGRPTVPLVDGLRAVSA
jgi:NAD(P)H dehydrogenase (quinone)